MSRSSQTNAQQQFENSMIDLALSINRQTNVFDIKNKILASYDNLQEVIQ